MASDPTGTEASLAPVGHETATAAATTATTPPNAETDPRRQSGYAGEAISASTASEPEADDPEEIIRREQADAVEFNIAVDIIYNRARASWLTRCHQLFLFGAIVAGSTAASDLASARVCAVVAAVCAAFDLIFDPATGASEHRAIVRAMHDALVDLKRKAFSVSSMNEAEIALLNVSSDENAPYNALRLLAYDQAIIALGRNRDDIEWVPWERRVLANLIRFEGWSEPNRKRWARLMFWTTT